jgi:hypothetical protein
LFLLSSFLFFIIITRNLLFFSLRSQSIIFYSVFLLFHVVYVLFCIIGKCFDSWWYRSKLLFYFSLCKQICSDNQNRINRPVKLSIRTNRTRKNRTLKMGWIEPYYCNRKLEWVVFLGPNPLYATHCPPLILKYYMSGSNSFSQHLWVAFKLNPIQTSMIGLLHGM